MTSRWPEALSSRRRSAFRVENCSGCERSSATAPVHSSSSTAAFAIGTKDKARSALKAILTPAASSTGTCRLLIPPPGRRNCLSPRDPLRISSIRKFWWPPRPALNIFHDPPDLCFLTMVGGDNSYNKVCSASAAEKETLILTPRRAKKEFPIHRQERLTSRSTLC